MTRFPIRTVACFPLASKMVSVRLICRLYGRLGHRHVALGVMFVAWKSKLTHFP